MNARKKVLITGATSGIGESLTLSHSYYDNKVIACGRNTQKLNELYPSVYKTLAFDVTKEAQIREAASQVDELDILILNAGDCRYIDDAKHFDGQLFNDIISINLASLGWLLQYFLPKVKRGGQVVFISSSASILPFPRAEAYGASKAGMNYLAESLRIDLKAEEIDVTLVHPGFIKTPLTDKNDFPMPFLISSEEAAERIYQGVNDRKQYLHFPKRLTLLLRFFSWLPSWCWHLLIKQERKA